MTHVRDWTSLGFILGEESITRVSLGQHGLLWAPLLRWHVAVYWACHLPTSFPSPGSDLSPKTMFSPGSSFDLRSLLELSVDMCHPRRTGLAWAGTVMSAVRKPGVPVLRPS